MEQVGFFKGGALPDISTLGADDVQITFDVVLGRSLNTCATCHNSEFQTAEKVLQRQDEILDRINRTGSGAMPPPNKGYKSLNSCQKQILVTWLDDQKVGRTSPSIKTLSACGDGQSTEDLKPRPTPSPEKPEVDFATLEVNFANLKKEILEPKCLRCHLPSEDKTKIKTILETSSDIEAQELISDTAEKSILYQVVIPGLNKRFMPPPQSGIPALTQAEADYLKRWIESVPPSEFDF